MPTSGVVKRATDQVDVDRGAIVAMLQSMIRKQPDGEAAVQALVAEELSGSGGRVEKVRFEPRDVPIVDEFASGQRSSTGERESVVASFEGQAGGRSLILFAHPDGEPISDTSAWVHPPFEGTIDNGRLYGWGVADDLLGVATAVCAMRAIAEAGVVLKGAVIVASTPSKRHARGVAAVLHHGYGADGAIYLHPAESGIGLRDIKAFTSGTLEFTVEVRGRRPETAEPMHTAVSHLGINPLDKALVLLNALHILDIDRGARIHHPALDDAVGRSTNILIATLQLGIANGAGTRMAETCTFGGSVTFPPSERMADVQAEVEAALSDAIKKDSWLTANPPALQWVSGITGMEVAAEHPLYRIVSSAIREIADVEPQVNALHSSSDIRNPQVQKGIPTVGFGPLCGDLSQTGHHDEWVDVEDFIRTVKVVARVVIEWCGTEQLN